tara:strand:+ start:215 stop:430 length:216 start_codon:yes stop_codon:yes gene_type:complete
MRSREIELIDGKFYVDYEYIKGDAGDYENAPESPQIIVHNIFGDFGELKLSCFTSDEILNIEEQIYSHYED